MIYLTLFFIAFVSGSLLPLGSEVLFLYDVKQGYNTLLLLLFATVGNVLGAVLNYFIGLKGEEYLVNRGYLKEKSLRRAKERFGRFGGFVLLLSAAPIIGDPLTFIAGVMCYNFKLFLLFVTLSKFLRYLGLTLFL